MLKRTVLITRLDWIGIQRFHGPCTQDQTINKIVKVAGEAEGGGKKDQEKEEEKY